MKIFEETTAQIVARELLKTHSVQLKTNPMFTWASGIKSPIYCDNRRLLSFPESRNIIVESFVKIVRSKYPETELIAGVATGAIAVAALVADRLNLPFAYVRAEAKSHGMGNKIEGIVKAKQKVLVVEDLVSTGGSSLAAVDALREADCDVRGMLAIFSYELPKALLAFSQADCDLTILSNFTVLGNEALVQNYISSEDSTVLKNWKAQF